MLHPLEGKTGLNKVIKSELFSLNLPSVGAKISFVIFL